MFVKYSFWKHIPDSENNNLFYKDMIEISEKNISENEIKDKIIKYLCKKHYCELNSIVNLNFQIIDKI